MRIKSLTKRQIDYNLQDMTTTHLNYVANGIIVHNSVAAGADVNDIVLFKKRIMKLVK